MQTTIKQDRWFFRCTYGCKQSWSVDLDRYPGDAIRSAQASYSQSAACPHCGHVPTEHPHCTGYILGHKIMGKVLQGHIYNIELSPPCDGRCTNAQGPSCDCACNGVNHGSKKLIEIKKLVA